MNRKELSAVIAECAEVTQRAAARTERARADIEVSRARFEALRVGIEAARQRQEEATAEHRVIVKRFEKQRAESAARWEKEQIAMREAVALGEKRIEESRRRFDEIAAELREQRDERRALIEALLQMVDRLPPPPPHLRSA